MAPPVVPFRRQEGADHCGAACLQMVIESLNQPSRTQQSLFEDAHDHGNEDPKELWFSPPDGMEWAFEQRAAVSRSLLDLVELTFEMALTRRLVWSLFQHSVPPIALVYGRDHWVVVADYDLNGTPTGPTDNNYEIKAVHIHNPWLSEGEDDPPPDALPEIVPLDDWLTTYLEPVEKGHWQGKRVAVGVFTE